MRLLGLHEQELSGYIVSVVPNWADADEIAQETKLRLWEQFEHYDPTKDFGAWARTIAYFMVLAYSIHVRLVELEDLGAIPAVQHHGRSASAAPARC